KLLPADFSCEKFAHADTPSFSIFENGEWPVLVASFPIQAGDSKGHLSLLHDPRLHDDRTSRARSYWAVAVGGVGLGIGVVATFFVAQVFRQWLLAGREMVTDARGGAMIQRPNMNMPLLDGDFRKLLRDFLPIGGGPEATHVVWTPRTLQTLITEELPASQVI